MKPIQSDEQLLDQFLAGRKDDSEDAFAILVERHGPMVLRVCRHVLHRDQDAEDACQITFLALARKAGAIRDRRMLGGWLYEVAYRTALRARARASRRRAIERGAMAKFAHEQASGDHDEPPPFEELRPVLNEEMDGLPGKYGIPVILGYVEGLTNREVADLLKCPIGTVKGRLSRARDMLRARLSRRGLDPNQVRSRWG
jgi:RNA polymerase sigma factor (sigma-70 family)